MMINKIKTAVDRIIDDLSDRRGLDSEWDSIDDDIKEEIKQKWCEIIKQEMM